MRKVGEEEALSRTLEDTERLCIASLKPVSKSSPLKSI